MTKNDLTAAITAQISTLQAALAELDTYRPSENQIRYALYEANETSREIWNSFLNGGTLTD